jgi:hypothetical protein
VRLLSVITDTDLKGINLVLDSSYPDPHFECGLDPGSGVQITLTVLTRSM